MKRLGVLLLGGFFAAAAVQVVPCSRGGSLHACCEKSAHANIANPYSTCCEQERASVATPTLTQNPSLDFQAAAPVFIAHIALAGGSKIFTPLRYHWPGASKSPVYLKNLTLLL